MLYKSGKGYLNKTFGDRTKTGKFGVSATEVEISSSVHKKKNILRKLFI